MRFVTVCSIFLVFLAAPAAYAAAGRMADLEAAVIQEDYNKAVDLANALLKTRLSNEDSLQAGYYLGLSHLRLGEYEQAYELFRKVVMGRPKVELYERSYVGVIDALYMQGYYENALKEALALMKKHPQSEIMGLIYLKVARSNLKLARWNKAREYLEKITSEYPDSFESRVARQLLDEKQYFTVQVGAFNEKGRAEHLVRELVARQEYAYVVETKMPDGKLFYRVRVGQLTALKDAKVLEEKLSGFGYPTLIYP